MTTAFADNLVGKSCIWGVIQHAEHIAPGIAFVSTAGHGGIKLDRARNAQVPDYMRRKGGWYEEDCDYAIPVIIFADEFRKAKGEDIYNDAVDSLRNWHPDEYARYFNVPLESLEGQSSTLDRRLFDQRHADDWLAVTAYGSWHDLVPDGYVGVTATKGGRGMKASEADPEERYYLIPQQEYAQRQVIDPYRHAPWCGPGGKSNS